MNLKKYKWIFYIFTFFLITVVATVLSAMKPGDKVPDVSNAILIVGATYGIIYLIVKLLKRLKKGEIEKELIKKTIAYISDNDNKIKKNKHRIHLILLGLLMLTGWFYWFEYRPVKIRQSCSWVKRHENAIIEQPPISEEELKKQGKFTDCSLYETFIGLCEEHNKILMEGQPAKPARDWWEKAIKEEYEFCLHENGLK